MAKPIPKEQLAIHFNRYLSYRRDVAATHDAKFKNTMGRIEIPLGKMRSSGGAQHQMPTRLGRAKTITTVQAQRLARYAPIIQESAMRHNVPVELICGVILQESGGNPNAASGAGAKGLMQLMDGTAKRFGVSDSLDPKQNIDGGTKYLRFLLDRFNGNVELALAGYNAGEGNVEKHGMKVPPFRETQNYVPAVLGYTQSMIDILAAAPALPANARRA